jgi:hypothetical protein
LLKAIEQNLSLESFLLIPHNPHKLNHQLSDIMKQVEQIVALNRAGRCSLRSHTDVGLPRSFWPYILAKPCKNADAIYFLLCENPQFFLNASISWKAQAVRYTCEVPAVLAACLLASSFLREQK